MPLRTFVSADRLLLQRDQFVDAVSCEAEQYQEFVLAERLAFGRALDLDDAAGASIRPLFRTAFAHEAKADASPVTEADRAAPAHHRDAQRARRLGVRQPALA